VNKNPKKFIVLSRGRTASTFLAKGLNRHPAIHMGFEIFHSRKPPIVNGVQYNDSMNSWDFLEQNFFGIPPENTKCIGFKLFYFHAKKTISAKAVWQALEEREDIKIIALSRINTFAAYVSEARARESKVWHPKAGTEVYEEPRSLTIDIDRMKRSLKNAEEQFTFGRELCNRKGGIEITYEQLRDRSDETFEEIVSWLGAGEQQVSWPKFLMSSESANATSITNMDAVAAALRECDSEWMLTPFIDRNP